jgi:hypothetical protein
MAFAAVKPADAAIEPSATLSFSFMGCPGIEGLAGQRQSVNEGRAGVSLPARLYNPSARKPR